MKSVQPKLLPLFSSAKGILRGERGETKEPFLCLYFLLYLLEFYVQKHVSCTICVIKNNLRLECHKLSALFCFHLWFKFNNCRKTKMKAGNLQNILCYQQFHFIVKEYIEGSECFLQKLNFTVKYDFMPVRLILCSEGHGALY